MLDLNLIDEMIFKHWKEAKIDREKTELEMTDASCCVAF